MSRGKGTISEGKPGGGFCRGPCRNPISTVGKIKNGDRVSPRTKNGKRGKEQRCWEKKKKRNRSTGRGAVPHRSKGGRRRNMGEKKRERKTRRNRSYNRSREVTDYKNGNEKK